MGTSTFPDIYALALRPAALMCVCIYQAKHKYPWYNYVLCSNLSLYVLAFLWSEVWKCYMSIYGISICPKLWYLTLYCHFDLFYRWAGSELYDCFIRVGDFCLDILFYFYVRQCERNVFIYWFYKNYPIILEFF